MLLDSNQGNHVIDTRSKGVASLTYSRLMDVEEQQQQHIEAPEQSILKPLSWFPSTTHLPNHITSTPFNSYNSTTSVLAISTIITSSSSVTSTTTFAPIPLAPLTHINSPSPSITSTTDAASTIIIVTVVTTSASASASSSPPPPLRSPRPPDE